MPFFFSLSSFLQIMLCYKIDYWHSKPIFPENEGLKKHKLKSRDTTTSASVLTVSISRQIFPTVIGKRDRPVSICLLCHSIGQRNTRTHTHIYIYHIKVHSKVHNEKQRRDAMCVKRNIKA